MRNKIKSIYSVLPSLVHIGSRKRDQFARLAIKIVSALLVAVLFLPVFALAADAAPTGDTPATKKTDAQQRPDTVRQDRVKSLMKLIQNQATLAEKTLTRLGAIVEKIQKVRTKLVEQGADLTEADRLIAQAKTQKQEAETLLTDLKTKAGSIAASADPKKAVQEFMSSANALKKKLRDLHKTLNDIVKALRKAEQATKKASEPTPTPTPPSTNPEEAN